MNENFSTVNAQDEEAIRRQAMMICDALYNKKAQDIMAIHVGDKTIIADWFVVCSGRATAQVKALCDEIEEKAEGMGLSVRRIEGYSEGRWIVIDFGSILVHIFYPEEREYYNMERLWVDDPRGFVDYSKLMLEKEREEELGRRAAEKGE
jgi:ribosome-associated protein